MSIDRRSFVQTAAAAAVGGAAGLSGDAVAQQVIFQAPPSNVHGPWKPYDPNGIGDQVQRIGTFLKQLFDEDQGMLPPGETKPFRQRIWEMNDKAVRDMIKQYFIYDVSYDTFLVMIVDIQNGRVRFSDGQGCTSSATPPPIGGACSVDVHGHDKPTQVLWYTLVLPPLPLVPYGPNIGQIQEGFLHELTSELAWHHAIVYGYGM